MPLFRLLADPPFETRLMGSRFVIAITWVDGGGHFRLVAEIDGNPFRFWFLESLGRTEQTAQEIMRHRGFEVPSGTTAFAIFRKLVEDGKAERVDQEGVKLLDAVPNMQQPAHDF